MAPADESCPQGDPGDLIEIEMKLRAIITQLDDAGQMLAAAYAELALGVLARERPRPETQFDKD